MSEKVFDFFPNPNLRLALYHRMRGNYKLTKRYLLVAAEQDNDGQALYILANAYFYGGFGIKQNRSKTDELFQRSSDAGCPWGTASLSPSLMEDSNDLYAKTIALIRINGRIDDPIICQSLISNAGTNVLIYKILLPYCLINSEQEKIFTQKATQLGDGLVQSIGSDWVNIKKAADQRVSLALIKLTEKYYKEGEYEKAMYYALKYDIYYSVVFHILQEYPSRKIHFMYGRKLSKLPTPPVYFMKSLLIYQNTIQMCRSAALSTVYYLQRILSKDVAKMIGRMIWDTKNDPEVWEN